MPVEEGFPEMVREEEDRHRRLEERDDDNPPIDDQSNESRSFQREKMAHEESVMAHESRYLRLSLGKELATGLANGNVNPQLAKILLDEFKSYVFWNPSHCFINRPSYIFGIFCILQPGETSRFRCRH